MAKFTSVGSEQLGCEVVLGADPGMTGCVVVIDLKHGLALDEMRWANYTPTEWLDALGHIDELYLVRGVLMEAVHAKPIPIPLRCGKCKQTYTCKCGAPGRGVRTSAATAEFKLGYAAGSMHFAFLAVGWRLELLPPEAWMREVKVQGKKHSPNGIRDKAQRLFPDVKPRPTQATGDAYLLAWLARQKYQGGQ